MARQSMFRQSVALVLSGFFIIFVICLGLVVVSMGVLVLSHVLSYLSMTFFQEYSMSTMHYVIVMLAVTCTACLAIPVGLLARNIRRSAESFSMLQFDEEEDEKYDDDEDAWREEEEEEELNDFLKKLHKTRNIGPFIPSPPKTVDDLCPCGSGLKYKDCCGKSWL